MNKKIKVTETQFKFLMDSVLNEQSYGGLVDTNLSGASVSNSGDATNQQQQKTDTINLFKDQGETQKLNAAGYKIKETKKLTNGQIEINFGNFKVTTDCTKISKNDTSFNYGNGVYYSKTLFDQVKPNCG